MNRLLKKMIPLFLLFAIAATGCSENSSSKTEEVEITTMDSTSKAIKENREKLEEQTQKVEASIEKLENEFDSTQ